MIRLPVTSAAILLTASALLAQPPLRHLDAELGGFDEVPSISTAGQGSFTAVVDETDSSIEYQLDYAGLEGEISQSHIHLGQPGVNGGPVLFLCTNLGNGPAGTPTCAAGDGSVTGTLTADDVVEQAGQGIAAGELGEVLAAIRAGATYVNVHTDAFPGGEIRGQVAVTRPGT